MANRVSPDNKHCREQSKKEHPAVSSAGLWNPNVRFLHLVSQDRFGEGCLGQSAAQSQDQ